jgi:hypothetical protein
MRPKDRLAGIAAGNHPTAIAPARPAAVLKVKIAEPGAKVFLLPGKFRGADYIKMHVEGVVEMGAEQGERHIWRNLRAIEDKLRAMGVDQASIAAELRRIEGQVRAELWRQILLPDGGDT